MKIETGKKYSYEFLLKMFGENNIDGVDSVEVDVKIDGQKYVLFFEPEHVYIDSDVFDIINSQCYFLKAITKVSDIKTYDFKEGIISKIFSEWEEWEEWENIFINGIGFLFYQVEDNAGSITIFVSQKKLTEPTYTEDVILYKLLFLGSYGNAEGKGTLYSNLDRKTNLYTERMDFKNYAEGYKFLEKKLNPNV